MLDDANEMKDFTSKLESKISNSSFIEVKKITPELVKEATLHLKPNKTDPDKMYTSDCYINAPDSLFQHMASAKRFF